MTLGDCGQIPAARARELAQAMLDDVTGGGRDVAAASEPPLLAEFSETFLASLAQRWKASTLATNQRAVTRMLIPPGTNPCAGLRRWATEFKAIYLGTEDYAVLGRVLRACEDDRPQAVMAIRFMALSGCRRGEALGLTRAMIDRNRAALPDAKSGPRSLWLGRATRRVLKRCPRSTTHVFARGDGQPLTEAALNPVWREVKRALGKPNLRLHDLRHSFASVAIVKGHDLVMVGGLLGHKDKGSTAGYVHLADTHFEAAVTRVGRHMGRIMGRKDDGQGQPGSVFRQYLGSTDRLDAFCAARGIDPQRSSRELRAWRAEQGTRAVQ